MPVYCLLISVDIANLSAKILVRLFLDPAPATDGGVLLEGGPGGSSTGGDGTITASLSANPATYEGPCPATGVIQFTGTITDTVGNRDVTYRFVFSTGSASTQQVLHFNHPGSQTVSTIFTLGDVNVPQSTGTNWLAIEILQPVQLQSNRALSLR